MATYQYKYLVLSYRDHYWSIRIHILPNCSCICSHHTDKLIFLCIHQCLLTKQSKRLVREKCQIDFTIRNFHLRISDHLHGSLEDNDILMSLSSKLNKNIEKVRKQLQNSNNIVELKAVVT